MTAERIVEAVRNIETETGFGPTHAELAEALGASPQHISGLRAALQQRLVEYDDDGRLIVVRRPT